MDSSNIAAALREELNVTGEWPVSIEATQKQLAKAQMRLERYRAALRLANTEIERRTQVILALTTFTYQASRSPTLTGLLKLALLQALKTTHTTTGAIVLIDKDTKELTLGVHKGLTPDLSKILTGQQLGQGAVALMPHLTAGSGALLEAQTSSDKQEKRLLNVSQLTSLVSLPLQLGPRLVGAMLVGLQEDKTFTPAELCFLMALSQELAIALESVQLRDGLWVTAEALLGGTTGGIDLKEIDETELTVTISTPFELPTPASSGTQTDEDDLEHLLAAMMEAEDEVQKQNADLQILNTIAEMMNRTLNLKEILQAAVDQTRNTLMVDAAWLYLVDETGCLEMRSYTGLSAGYVRGMQRLKKDKEIEEEAATENKALFIEFVAQDRPKHKIWIDREKLTAIAAMPITRPDFEGQPGESHVIGVLAAGKKDGQRHLWSPREVRLLTSIANQVALAINNAQFYAQLQEDEAGLRAGNEVLRTVNDMLLEKNAFLEGFLQDDLIPALTVAAPVLGHLLAEATHTLTDSQKLNLATLKNVIGKLSSLAVEAGEVSHALDNAFGQSFKEEEQAQSFASATNPIRLEKKDTGKLKLKDPEPETDSPAPDANQNTAEKTPETEPTPPGKKPPATDLKPMTFEEAVAAGLVPSYILNRE